MTRNSLGSTRGQIDTDDDQSTENDPVSDRLHPYRWTCPFCEKVGLVGANSVTSDEGAVMTQARTALKMHVYESTGDGHGSKRAYPPDFDPDSLGENVDPLR